MKMKYIWGKILLVASKLAKMKNIHESGYRLITNCNKDGGQEIDYLHFSFGRWYPIRKNDWIIKRI